MNGEIRTVERRINKLTEKLNALRKANPAESNPNCDFQTQQGTTSHLDLFGENDKLFVIHNMGG